MRKLAGVAAALLVACLIAASASTPSDAARRPAAAAHASYDGLWSVTIYTRTGPCDAAYRYPARIVGSRVIKVEGDFGYDLQGVVTRNGQISVTVSRLGESATGYGRLHGSRGGGWWRTGHGQCSGTWTAVRRG